MMLVDTNFDFKNPDYVPIIRMRVKRLMGIREKRDKYLPALYKYYAEHPIDFIEDWMWTYDPRVTPAWRPFILWQKQKEYIEWLMERNESKTDGIVEKSRDAGATWLSMAFSIWMWRFHQTKIGFGSRKEALVDRLGDPDSIFEKGRLILDRLPPEFLPVGYERDLHSTHMKFINPENGSTITGEAGDNIGRGGRSTMYFKDESAYYERPMKIESALSQNSDVKIDISTPNGIGNVYYQKRMSKKLSLFIFDWRDDPRKDEAWYKDQVDKNDPIIVSQEIDRDYGGSVEGIVIPSRWVQSAIGLVLPKSGIKRAGLDVADEGADKNALAIAHGSVLELIEAWHKGNTTETTRKAVGTCRLQDCFNLRYDKIGVGAGVKGELLSNQLKYHDIRSSAICSGSSPVPGYYEDSGKKNEDMFLNLRSQMWWILRRRFEKTFEHVSGIKEHSPDDMISIPNDHELIAELSQVKYKFSGNGKIQIESKESMHKRGVKSPNKADAVTYCFAPIHHKRIGAFGRQASTSNSTINENTVQEIVGHKIGVFGRNKRLRMAMGVH